MSYFDDPFGDPFASPVNPTVASSNVRQASDETKLKTLLDKICAFAPPDAAGLFGGKAIRPILLKADIPLQTLKEVWVVADSTNRGSLTRDELKTLLALIALVQQGRVATLEAIRATREVLVPTIQNIDELIAMAPAATPAQSSATPFDGGGGASAGAGSSAATTLPFSSSPSLPKGSSQLSFQTMIDRETVEIKVSERVGTKLLAAIKTVYYEVTSKLFRTTVTRRYSDFAWLHEALLKRYPYRLIPPMPPKQIVGLETDKFLEDRRRGLGRFMEFIGRHSLFSVDEDVRIFYTEANEDRFIEYKKTRLSAITSEFYSHPKAASAKDLLPAGADDQLKMVRDKLPTLAANVGNMVDCVERMLRRLEGDAGDYVKFGHALETIIDTEFPATWVMNNRNYKVMTTKYEALGKLYGEEASKCVDTMLENLKHHQSIAVAFQELFVRRSQTTQKDVQTLVKRIQNNKAKLSTLTAKGTVGKTVDSVIQQIEQDEKEIELLGKLDDFVTYCLWEEMAFFNLHKAFLSVIIRDFVKGRFLYTDKILDQWRQMEPYVMDLPTAGF